MSGNNQSLSEIDEKIAIASENLRDLLEQAAARSGAADEELMSQRIAEQTEQLDSLKAKRERLANSVR
jgi:precorrin-2 methylase